MSRTYYAPAFTEPVNHANILCEEIWENVPVIDGFRSKGATSYFMQGYASAKVAHDDKYLYMKASYDHFDKLEFNFEKKYGEWKPDNSAEFFIKAGDTLHQFEINPICTECYFINGNLAEGNRVTYATFSTQGQWSVIARIPLALLGDNLDGLKFNIRVNLKTGIKDFFEPSCIVANEPVDGLRLGKAMSAEECRQVEEDFNADYYKALLNMDSLPECRLYCLAASHSSMDLSPVTRTIEAFQASNSTEARVKYFMEMRRKISEIESFIFTSKGEKECGCTLRKGPLTADFSIPHGRLKKYLNGINGGPRLNNQQNDNENEEYRRLRTSITRLHDIPLTNPGMKLVDVIQIFGNWNDDPANPDSYYFKQTDDYLMNLKSLGMDIVYRLGQSIEHSLNKYFVHAPQDYAKYAEICAGIVRHYNCGWANGFKMGIQYWEFWNEPDCGPSLWDKSMEDYCNFYIVVAKRLKAEFPDIKVGGPAIGHLRPSNSLLLLRRCLEEDAPLDFFSWHRYGTSPDNFVSEAFSARKMLDAFGFAKTEIHINEWHFAPGMFHSSDTSTRRWFHEAPDGMMGRDAAAFNLCTLIRWQDSPLDVSNFYMGGSSLFGFRHAYGELNKNYYSFLALAGMYDCPNLVATTTDSKDTCVLAGHDGNGNAAVIISAFRHDGNELTLQVDGLDATLQNVIARIVDSDNDLSEINANVKDNVIKIPKQPGSAVIFVKILAKN